MVAATDYMRAFADQIRAVRARRPLPVLGTDGFGRSDYRRNLRRAFEVDRHYVAGRRAVLAGRGGRRPGDTVAEAIERYGIDPDKPTRRATPDDDIDRHRVGSRHDSDRHNSSVEVTVPDIGDFTDVPVIEIHVAPGDVVAAEDPLVTLESDKATMDVPSPAAGTVRELRVAVGDHRQRGHAVILLVDRPASGAVSPPPRWSSSRSRRPPAARSPPQAAAAGRAGAPAVSASAAAATRGRARRSERAAAGPRAGRRPRRGRRRPGRKGRITKDDLLRFVRGPAQARRAAAAPPRGAGIPEIPAQDFSKFGPVETQPLSRIKRVSGPHLHRSWLNVPHVTHHDEADITDLDAYRKELDTAAKAEGPYRVTLLAFLLKASVSALSSSPSSTARSRRRRTR